MQGTIYKIQNKINNKIYIGQTTRDVSIRWKEHIKAALSDAEVFEKIHLYNGMRKYGIENFQFSIVESNITDIKTLNERESYWIEYYKSFPDGYNMNKGGNNPCIYDYEQIQELWLKDKTLTHQQLANIIGCSLTTIYNALKILPDYVTTREVGMYNENGVLLKTFSSTRKASYDIFGDLNHRSSIKQACDEKTDKAYGYIWHYLDTEKENYYTPIDLRIKCIETKEIYSSISDASQKTGINRKGINNCILKKNHTAGGFHWCKINDSITIEEIEKDRKATGNARKVKCIETGEIFNSINQAKEIYGGDIRACCAGRQKTAGSKHWCYIDG